MPDLCHETTLMGTAYDLGVVLGAPDPQRFAFDVAATRGHITLNMAQARRLLAIASRDPFTAGWNQLYDFKDTQPAGSDANYTAYEVLHHMEAAFPLLGLNVPTRFDNKKV